MLECFRGARPAFGALSEEHPQEVFRLTADTDTERKMKSLILNFTRNFLKAGSVKWRLPSEEHIKKDPHRPDVASLVVLTVDHFRSYEQRRACKRWLEVVCCLSKTEVDQLEGSLGRKENVVRLDVPMHNTTLVTEVESLQQLSCDGSNSVL